MTTTKNPKRTPPPPGPYLRTAEAAAILCLAPRTLDNWRSRGYGPRSLRIGGRVVYPRPWLDEWLSEQAAAI